MPESNRLKEWREFSKIMEDHVENYTVAQYGDYPTDELSSWNSQKCIDCIARYTQRHGRNIRGKESDLQDKKKIAHYACVAYMKMLQEG
jgi:hypothetical protein